MQQHENRVDAFPHVPDDTLQFLAAFFEALLARFEALLARFEALLARFEALLAILEPGQSGGVIALGFAQRPQQSILCVEPRRQPRLVEIHHGTQAGLGRHRILKPGYAPLEVVELSSEHWLLRRHRGPPFASTAKLIAGG